MLEKIKHFFTSPPIRIYIFSSLFIEFYFWVLTAFNSHVNILFQPFTLVPCTLGLAALQIFHSEKILESRKKLIWIFTSGVLTYFSLMSGFIAPFYILFSFEDASTFYILVFQAGFQWIAVNLLASLVIGFIQFNLKLIKEKKCWVRYLLYCHTVNVILLATVSTLVCLFFIGGFSRFPTLFGITFGLMYSILTRRALNKCLTDD
jgi:hypothetical protein